VSQDGVMSKRPIRIAHHEALDELRSMLRDGEPFYDEQSVEHFDGTLGVYESLLIRAFDIKPKRGSPGGVGGLLKLLVDRCHVEDEIREKLREVEEDIYYFRAMVTKYFGKRTFEGTLEEAESYRKGIDEALILLVDAIEASISSRAQ